MIDDLARDKCHEKIESDKQPWVADAVPVVRCRDCKYARPLVQEEWVTCIMWRRGSLVDGFCHMGAKMDGGEHDVAD